MNASLGPIPPPDPQRDAARRAAAGRRDGESVLFVGLLLGQFLLAFVLGGWAAGSQDGAPAGWAAVGFTVLLILAHALGYFFMLVFGGVALLAFLPRLFRARPPQAAPPAPHEDRLGKAFFVALVALHGATLLFGGLLLCGLLAASGAGAGLDAWWRYAVVALVLTGITARLLLAWKRADTF